MSINWTTTGNDLDLIKDIVERALCLGLTDEVVDSEMDITAVHCNGCPLRLADLLAADDANFIHDFCGISRHIDRTTGQLRNYFLPRFALPAGH